MIIFLQIYLEFLKIGFFAVGGGIALVPFLYQLSFGTGWFGQGDIINMFAISGIMPGPLGINLTTFAGYHSAGIWGAFVANLGLVTPSVILMVFISNILKKFMDNKYAQNAFKGAFAAVCALISVTIYKIMHAALFDSRAWEAGANFLQSLRPEAILFFVLLLIAIRRWKAHPFLYICISAALGLVIRF